MPRVKMQDIKLPHSCSDHSQVIAFTCCFITVILMVAATSTSDWIQGDGWREGLFEKCVHDYAPLPLPFGIEAEAGCSKSRGASEL